jgi:hypothetical protein
MAAKLEADLNKQENKREEKDNIVAKCNRCVTESWVDSREEFTEIFRHVVVNIMLAAGDAEPSKVLCYLKDAREVALRALKRN